MVFHLVAFINRILGREERARHGSYRTKYDLAGTFRFNGVDIRLTGPGRIHFGGGSYIGARSFVHASADHSVVVGDNCAISNGVRISTITRDPDFDITEEHPRLEADIVIGDAVWIGMNVYISPGVSIGDHAVVGANSVVTHDVEPWWIVGGVPAKPIRRKRHAPS